MADRRRARVRCAIYTRKSSEEGLEQDFNSLHAQREACEAFVTSQKHEGWATLPVMYDDGGISGGTIERPALQRLLKDVAAGQVDIVVVYKVDRLTRSLTDFARIVEIFDRHGVSFVSVTQAFNTTTSMGRLTLNVLLSFAQFEREVTGERIRDKIRASKQKGLWMGGFTPFGYCASGRTLAIDEAEAETVRMIYARYLECGSVDKLKELLEREGVRTRLRPGRNQRMAGGVPFSRGHLYRLLSNPIYVGRIRHKTEIYGGQHDAIIDEKTYQAVQQKLRENSHARLVKSRSKHPNLLTGLLYDEHGVRLVASHAVKEGRRYRYYLGAGRKGGAEEPDHPAPPRWRLPAQEVEDLVVRMMTDVLSDPHWITEHAVPAETPIEQRRRISRRAADLVSQLRGTDPIARRGIMLMLVQRIIVGRSAIQFQLKSAAIAAPPDPDAPVVLEEDEVESDMVCVSKPLSIRRRGPETRLIIEGSGAPEPTPDPAILKAVSQAHRWWQDLLHRRYATIREIATAYSTDERYVASILPLAFLSFDLTRQILDGTHPPELTLHRILKEREFPPRWREQEVWAWQ